MHILPPLLPILIPLASAASYYPNSSTSLLEHILVSNFGAYSSNFSTAITPCTNYVSQTGSVGANSGRTTAAQWLRVLFHDFVTANVSAGTGGVDASIGFETARAENSGSAFNDSFSFWRPYVQDGVAMADLIALGTAMASNLCGGRNIPYRSGRVDATAAGTTTGVPAPETNLEETLEMFERAGFGKVDAIGLTACGHTMGSVHHGGFPDVVDGSAVTPSNTNGGSDFDYTRGVFDPNVLGEYLNGTGKRGGPLVTSSNVTSRSDLRLYESDQNATMRALFAQGDGFLDTCVDLLSRAMNTVPTGVQLSSPIEAMPVKPVNVTFDFDADGKLQLSGKIRVLTPAGTVPAQSLTFRISDYSTNLAAEDATGSSVFGRSGSTYGTLTYFPFVGSGAQIRNATSFSLLDASAGIHYYNITSHTFVVPSRTTLSGTALNVTIASSSCDDLTVQVAAPLTEKGTLAPTIKGSGAAIRQVAGDMDGYAMCNGLVELESVPTGLVAVKAVLGGQVVDTLMVNGGAAGW